jgi:hypothetical protein
MKNVQLILEKKESMCLQFFVEKKESIQTFFGTRIQKKKKKILKNVIHSNIVFFVELFFLCF